MCVPHITAVHPIDVNKKSQLISEGKFITKIILKERMGTINMPTFPSLEPRF